MFSSNNINKIIFVSEILFLAIGNVALAIYIENIPHSMDWISMVICGITIMPTTAINTYVFDRL